MLIVAILSYLFSLQLKADRARCVRNYFTGLFHDLPEVLTRDIINPVKGSVEGLKELIGEYEREEMDRRIYKLLPQGWHEQMRMFTENEFTDLAGGKDAVLRDGILIKAIDNLTAFIEAHLALHNGIKSDILQGARSKIIGEYKDKKINGIDFGALYCEFQ